MKRDSKTKEPPPVTCQISYDYLLRHVVSKDRERAEGLHDVHFWQGSAPAKKITLVPSQELRATVFAIYKGSRSKNKANVINLEGPFGGESAGSLQFGDYDSAREFLRWIKETQNTTVANYKLYYGPSVDKTYLTKDDIPLLTTIPVGLNYDVSLPSK